LKNKKKRCWWCGNDPLYVHYHDTEWGRPVKDDRKIFEMLCLEGFQAGLSWYIVLKKRENFRRAFKNFDPKKVSRMTKADVKRLMQDQGIVRNRLKIESAITNAKAFLKTQEEFKSFSKYIWAFTNYKTIRTTPAPSPKTIKAYSKESDAISKDLKKRGFKFVGSTIIYAYMQATGMVNDHTKNCFLRNR